MIEADVRYSWVDLFAVRHQGMIGEQQPRAPAGLWRRQDVPFASLFSEVCIV